MKRAKELDRSRLRSEEALDELLGLRGGLGLRLRRMKRLDEAMVLVLSPDPQAGEEPGDVPG